MVVMPELQIELCDACGLCVAVCHAGGIMPEEGKVRIVETEGCDFCGVCEAVCPQCAIRCCYCIICREED